MSGLLRWAREDKDTLVVIEHQPSGGNGFDVGVFPKKG